MARYTGSKCKLCRREGKKLFLKGTRCDTDKCPIERKGAVPPGEPLKRKRIRQSGYRDRLREKQRVKRTYGVLEKQFVRYIKKSEKSNTDFGTALLRLLETRLDNVVRRLGFARSLNRSRQLVNHGHIMVDGRKVDIPSYNVKRGQVISVNPDSSEITAMKKSVETVPSEVVPSWLLRKALTGKLDKLPEQEDLTDEFDFGLVVEYYSR